MILFRVRKYSLLFNVFQKFKKAALVIPIILSINTIAQTNPTAPAQGFNVFLHQFGNIASNEIQGAMAMGGNFTLNGNYSLATQSAGSFLVGGKPIGLLVGGSVLYSSGNVLYVNSGYVKIGNGTGSTVWYQDEYGGNNNLRITNGGYNNSPSIQLQTSAYNLGVSAANNPVIQENLLNFDSAFAIMQASSACMSTYKANVTVYNSNLTPIPSTGLPSQIKFNLNAGLNVLNVLGSDLNNVTDFIYNNNAPDANHIMIINVNAPGAFNWNIGNTSGAGLSNSPYIIYNFYNTTRLTIAGYGSVEGTIFAPFADIINTSNYSSIEGQVIGNSLTKTVGGIHNATFNAQTVSCLACSPTSLTINASICKNSSYLFNGTSYTTPGSYTATYKSVSGCDSTVTLVLSYVSDSVFVWTGSKSTNWADASNWCSNSLPAFNNNILIPGGITNYPVCDAVGYTQNITIVSDASLKVTGTLQIAGSINNSGLLIDTAGTIVLNGTSPQTIPQNAFAGKTIKNLTINNTTGVTLADSLYITGVLTPQAGTLFTNGLLTIVSSRNGTALIAQGNGNYINGAVTVQRYIPNKTIRKYSFIGSSVIQSVKDSWQKQIYITGPGTGGQVCGQPNSNGFDATNTNTASMVRYDSGRVNNSHWVTIPNTSVSLTPGIGYDVNIRGDRNSTTVTCDNQLNTNTPAPPEAVTLSATGVVTTGSLTVPLNNPSLNTYTLLANPYPCPISFSAFQATNATVINNQMWTFCPYGSGNYTTFSHGIIANPAAGYDNVMGNYIASGQAFFVKSTVGGNVTFNESHKVSASVSGTQYFGTNPLKMIRIGLIGNNNKLLDEVVARFNNNGANSYVTSWDALSLSSASQTLAITKPGKNLAIATFSDSVKADTVSLALKSTSVGAFNLVFSDYAGLDTSVSILLYDKYLSNTYDIRRNQVYAFNVTSDTASVGANRFKLFVNSSVPLPVSFNGFTGKLKNGLVQLGWSVANELNIKNYLLERSLNGVDYSTLQTINATKASSYNAIDTKPFDGISYYRVKAVGNGNSFYSNAIQIDNKATSNKWIKVFPTLVTNNKVTIAFANMPLGNYRATLVDMLGKEIVSQSIINSGNTTTQTIDFAQKAVATGAYQVAIMKDGVNVYTTKVVIE